MEWHGEVPSLKSLMAELKMKGACSLGGESRAGVVVPIASISARQMKTPRITCLPKATEQCRQATPAGSRCKRSLGGRSCHWNFLNHLCWILAINGSSGLRSQNGTSIAKLAGWNGEPIDPNDQHLQGQRPPHP